MGIDDLVVLVITPQHYKVLHRSTHITTAVVRASILAENGVNVLMIMPRKEDGFEYSISEFPMWSDKLVVVDATSVKDQETGIGFYTADIIKVVSQDSVKSPPFDAVLNYNTPMSVGLQRLLCAKTNFTGIKPPMLTTMDIAASYDEWNRNPLGTREWYKAWEILEAYSPLFDYAIIDSPYDYKLMLRQFRRLMSPSMARSALANFEHVWGARAPISEKHLHKIPKRGESFDILIAGSFGRGRENCQPQAETMIKAVGALYKRGYPIKLKVCTYTQEDDWQREALEGTENFVEVFRSPSFPVYKKIFKAAHFGVQLRTVSDGYHLTWVEFMMSGKPTVWYRNEYNIPWVPSGTQMCVDQVGAVEVAAVLVNAMSNYAIRAEKAMKLADLIYARHAPNVWAERVKNILSSIVAKSEVNWRKRNFPSYIPIFEEANTLTPLPFDKMYKELNKMCNGGLSLFSKTWAMKMMRKYGNVRMGIGDGELIVIGDEE